MNPTLLTEYNKRLEIAKAKIEALDMVIRHLNDRSVTLIEDHNCNTENFAIIDKEIVLHIRFIQAYQDGIKDRIIEDWQRLEPKPEDYGWETGYEEHKDILDAQSYLAACNQWQELEPFKTDQNAPL